MNLSFIKTEILKNSTITTVGTVINGALGAAFYIILARALGPNDFGLVTVSITTLTLVADVADLGTNSGLIRFVSSHLDQHKSKALEYLRLGLQVKLLSWLVVLIGGFFLAPSAASFIFQKSELTQPLRLAVVGVGGAMLFSYATTALQSFQKFFAWSFINILTNFIRLLGIIVLIAFSRLNLSSALVAYISLPFFGFFIALLLLPTKEILKAHGEKSNVKTFFSFNKWISLMILITALSSRMDTFLSARLLSTRELGLYSSANQLTAILPQIVSAIGIVAAPKFARFTTFEEMIVFFKKFQMLVLAIALGIGIIAIPFAGIYIPLLYGEKFAQATPYFIVLLLAQLVFLISVPVHNAILYYLGNSAFFVPLSVVNLIFITVGGSLLIPRFGPMGAALTVLLAMLLNFLISIAWFIVKGKK